MPYDPTFGVPNANPTSASRFIAPEVFRAVGALPVDRAAASRFAGRRWRPCARSAATRCRPSALAVVVVAARARGAPAGGAGSGRRRRSGAAAAFASLAEALARDRTPRARTTARRRSSSARSPPTPSCRRLVGEARTVVRAFERERFSAAGVSADEVAEAAAAAGRARELAASAPRAGAPR